MFARATRLSAAASSRISSPISAHIQRQQRTMASITTHKLNTGQSIPAIGFGTWQDKDDQEKAVTEALKAGYRHIDTAAGMLESVPFQCFILILSYSIWHGAHGRRRDQEERDPSIRVVHHHQALEQQAQTRRC